MKSISSMQESRRDKDPTDKQQQDELKKKLLDKQKQLEEYSEQFFHYRVQMEENESKLQ